METKPFIDIILAMDENNAIGLKGNIPWALLPTDHRWYLTLATTTKDPSKRIALILGRLTFYGTSTHRKEFRSRWHFIVITQQSAEELHKSCPHLDQNQIDVATSFGEAVKRAKLLVDTPSARIEFAVIFGGARAYEEGILSKYIRRVYLTRIFTKVEKYDVRVSNFDLTDFQRIKRSNDEVLAELDDQIIEESGLKYQFQVYERKAKLFECI